MKKKNGKKASGGVNSKWFKVRRNYIKRKTRELSVLCGVKACAVIIGPDGKLETWPENSAEVLDVIRQFQNSGTSEPGSLKSPVASGRKRQEGTATVRTEEKDENFKRFSENLDKEETRNHIPNVAEFDEWVKLNWSDRTPKQEKVKGYMQLLLDEDVDEELLLIPNDPNSKQDS